MRTWCRSFWKQRKARLPDSIQILPVRRNAATFQKERIPLGQMAFVAGPAFSALARASVHPSAAAFQLRQGFEGHVLTPKNPFCLVRILNEKRYKI